MKPYYADESVTLYHGDCLEVLATLPDASVDAVVTDPPYELLFMSRSWDGSGIAYSVPMWAHCLRVLKPGGHLLAFGGTRTYHRMACAIEDAGFEIRDSIHWTYGSGFPKSLDVSKAIDKAAGATPLDLGVSPNWRESKRNREASGRMEVRGENAGRITAPATDAARQWQGWGTALKPSHEPIVVARKPLSGTVAATVLEHGTGAINVDACRVGTGEDTRRNAAGGDNGLLGTGTFKIRERRAEDQPERGGRWPANTILTHAADCGDVCGPSCPVAEMDRQSGVSAGQSTVIDGTPDYGGASRFFPTFYYTAKASSAERPDADGTRHPTVKPLDLMRWLVRLITPPGGTVLEPFAGSGTTAEACVVEGLHCIAIERETDYLPLIVARLTKPIERTLL